MFSLFYFALWYINVFLNEIEYKSNDKMKCANKNEKIF